MTVDSSQPVLSEAEWAIILELLIRERHDLPIEIHHTSARGYREGLRRRLGLIEDLIVRLEEKAA
jgi:hypothetical protein